MKQSLYGGDMATN